MSSNIIMPILLNLLPNVFWCYNDITNPKPQVEFNVEVHKFCIHNQIRNKIDIDTLLHFWGKSEGYMYDVKMAMQKDEFTQLLTVYKELVKNIQNAYLTNTPTIFILYNNKYLDTGLGLWLYYFNQYAKISFDNVLKMISMKVIGHIPFGDVIKRFFLLLTANTI
jgi:hypothetical protein